MWRVGDWIARRGLVAPLQYYGLYGHKVSRRMALKAAPDGYVVVWFEGADAHWPVAECRQVAAPTFTQDHKGA